MARALPFDSGFRRESRGARLGQHGACCLETFLSWKPEHDSSTDFVPKDGDVLNKIRVIGEGST